MPPGLPRRRRRSRKREGLTLVETAIVVFFVATFIAVFVPTFIREVSSSKLAEASIQLDELHRRTAAYYARTHEVDGGARRFCLPALAGPTPAVPSPSPVEVDFFDDEVPGHPTWEALGFQPGSIRFRYTFIPEVAGCGVRPTPEGGWALTLRAEGDLDGNGRYSLFERRARVGEDHVLVPEGMLLVENRVE